MKIEQKEITDFLILTATNKLLFEYMIDTYKSLCTEFYDLDKPLAPDDALEYYLNQIQLSSQPVLEPMCGTGRFLIPLFENGIDIDGIDASEHMLEKCRIKAGEKNLHPKLYLQKLEDMKVHREYGLVFLPSGSFGLLTENPVVLKSLKNMYDSLMPKGRILFEISTPSGFTEMSEENVREVFRNDGSKIRLTIQSKFEKSSNIETMICIYEDVSDSNVKNVETEIMKIKYYDADEIRNFLNASNFENYSLYGGYSGMKAVDSNEMIVVEIIKTK
ncbi:MAG: class I SAM-dependent methyltransferase [Ignavibacteria bacterium]|nr:class I SAM-dependent methyltransferase [Ignavibacteria bacterium]